MEQVVRKPGLSSSARDTEYLKPSDVAVIITNSKLIAVVLTTEFTS
jgi:azurin